MPVYMTFNSYQNSNGRRLGIVQSLVRICSSIKSPELYQSSSALLPNSQHGCPSKQRREIICSHQLLGYSLWMTDVCGCKWERVPRVMDSCALIAYANWMSESISKSSRLHPLRQTRGDISPGRQERERAGGERKSFISGAVSDE